jgi:phosphoglycolate phosphatase
VFNLIPFKNIKTIFFDYDGTLHNSIKVYFPAFKKAYDYLVKEGLAESREWTEGEISHWLGFNPKDMWETFLPALDEGIRKKCSKIIGDEMESLIKQGKPVLYEEVLETLAYLKNKDYHLVFISNCNIYYRDGHIKLFNLDKYFEELACSEEYGFIPKHEILGRIKRKYPGDMVIIGDRKQDIEAGKKNDIYTIGCSYGFSYKGELDEADLLIDNITELKKYL